MSKKKRNNKESKSNIHAVFRLKPIKKSNMAVLKCVGHINETNEICDEPLVCNRSNPEDIFIYKITDTIYAKFFRCNIRDSYVMTSRTLPVLYASIMYQNNLICGLLFNMFIDFIIETDIKSEKQLINTNLNGKYQLRIKVNEKGAPKILELDEYDSTEFIIDMMKTLLETEEMKLIISKLMEERRKERLEKMGSIEEEVDIPKPKYNFTQLVEQYKKNGKIDLDD